MAAILLEERGELLPKDHAVIYSVRCVKCGHQWECSTGWLPLECPKCANRIEYGDHLSAHLEIIEMRFEGNT